MGVSEINFAVNLTYGNDGFLQDTGNSTELWDAFYLQYIFNGILLPIVAVVGTIGNILTMVVLWRKEMQSTTILFLRALVLTDTGIIIVVVVALTPFTIALFHPEMWYFKDVIYPKIYTACFFLIMTIQMCNVYITVSVSLERYIAICCPFRAAKLLSRKKVYITLAIIVWVSILYNIPRLLATTVKSRCQEPLQHECYLLVDTAFGDSFFYKKVYMVWMYASIIYIIPLGVLSMLNILIIMELMRMRKRRLGTNIQDDQEANLSLVLVLIVVVFILCQTPGLFAQFDFLFNAYVMLKWLAISNILFVMNSSVNFLIYTFVGQKFRRVLMRMFKGLFRKTERQDEWSNTRTTRLLSRASNGAAVELNCRPYTPVTEVTEKNEHTEKSHLND